MNYFEIALPDGRSITVNAPDAQTAAGAARNFLAKEKGGAMGKSDAGNIDQGLSQAFGQGATLGYGDELTAAVRAAMPALSNWMMRGPALQREGDAPQTPQTVSTAGTFGERYSEELARERAKAEEFKKQHSTLATGANIAGNVATGALAFPTMGASAGGSLLGNMGRMGATGAALGGVQGFGEGEGGFANRMGTAAFQGAAGGALGAALPVVGTAGTRLTEAYAPPLLRKLSAALEGVAPRVTPKSLSAAAPEGGQVPADSLALRLADALSGTAERIEDKGAARDLAMRATQQKTSPDQLQARLDKLGPNAVLADLGPQFRAAANGAALRDGEIAAQADQVLGGRAKQYTPMLKEAFTGGADVPSLYKAGQAFDEHARTVGNDLYGQMRSAGLNVSPEMQALIDKTPRIKEAIKQITEDAAANGRTLEPVDVMHKVKEAIQQKSAKAMNSDTYLDKAGLGDLETNWAKAFWEANPAAKTADTGYAHAKSLSDYLDSGRRFMQEGTTPGQLDVSSEAMADRLAAATGHQQGAYTLGVQNAGIAGAQANPTNFAKKLAPENAGIAEKIRLALGDEGVGRVHNAADAVRTFQETRNYVRGGSSTARNLGDVDEVGGGFAKITEGEGGPRIRFVGVEHLQKLVNALEKPGEGVIKRIGEASLRQNPEENARMIEMLRQILAQRRAPGHAGIVAAGSHTAGDIK